MTPMNVDTLRKVSAPVSTVYVAIGNSDDKLSQNRWVCFLLDTKQAIHDSGALIHGEWTSYPDSIYQNACFCFEIDDDKVPELKGELTAIAVVYDQDAISWVETTATEFLGASKQYKLNHPKSDRWTGGDKKAAK